MVFDGLLCIFFHLLLRITYIIKQLCSVSICKMPLLFIQHLKTVNFLIYTLLNDFKSFICKPKKTVTLKHLVGMSDTSVKQNKYIRTYIMYI